MASYGSENLSALSAPEPGISIREFARRDGCSEKLVRRALTNGHLTARSDGSLDPSLVGTGWRKTNRRRADTADTTADKPAPVRTGVSAPPAPVRTARESAPADAEADLDGALASVRAGTANLAEAERVKANFLAVRAMNAVRREAGELIETAAAEQAFFDAARAGRDAWLNWPSRIGPLVAADLNLEADRVTEVLTAHVHKHLAELGEPEHTFAQPG